MSKIDYFQWWRQAPFACALFRSPQEQPEQAEFVAANAVFKVVTGLSSEQLQLCQAEDFNRRAVYYSVNTSLSYQVQSYAPDIGLLLITLHQIPNVNMSVFRADSAMDTQSLTALMLDIAQRFIGIENDELPVLLNQTLAQLGSAVAADRVYIFDYDFNKQTCSNTFEWCANGIVPEINNLQQVPLTAIPQWVNAHQRGGEMYIPDVPSLPHGDALKQLLQPQGIKSLLALPILADTELFGFVGFDSVKQHHYYSEHQRLLLGVFSRMLVKIKQQYRFESAIPQTLA
ncbi:hypothetical protein GCM10010919_10410 [Alishewanella longhuensis]|uniref:GAF domain-containing protein n=1 Tax=Alishewanella longhuensis TaxID=1091037 RepID=A0ABQ3KWP6_9ALTE|nr:GAF domain-containing protein [Alishewanella longhuensis]GHG64089.1 hypothetical protein GCM10010919_10410 [Alishewanella longhuensis]